MTSPIIYTAGVTMIALIVMTQVAGLSFFPKKVMTDIIIPFVFAH
jgi:hypothetical protein